MTVARHNLRPFLAEARRKEGSRGEAERMNEREREKWISCEVSAKRGKKQWIG